MTNVNRYTRARKSGRNIVCPQCAKSSKVYNFAWSALLCSHCRAEVEKKNWLVKEVSND